MLLTESATLHLFESSSYCYESVRVFYCCSASVYNNNQKSCAYFVVEVLEVTESIGIEVYQVRLFVTQRLKRENLFSLGAPRGACYNTAEANKRWLSTKTWKQRPPEFKNVCFW